RRGARRRLHRPHIRHQATLRPGLVRKFSSHEPRTCRSKRRVSSEPTIVSQLRFNTDLIPDIAAQLATLATSAWIDAGQQVVALGDSGTGKTHLLIGLGLAACEQGRRVRYATTAALVNELAEAADNRQLSSVVARYGRLDLLLLDELGYVRLDPRAVP